MRTIHFKNGEKKEVTQENLDIMCKKVAQTGARIQAIATIDTEEIYLFVNFDEVTYID